MWPHQKAIDGHEPQPILFHPALVWLPSVRFDHTFPFTPLFFNNHNNNHNLIAHRCITSWRRVSEKISSNGLASCTSEVGPSQGELKSVPKEQWVYKHQSIGTRYCGCKLYVHHELTSILDQLSGCLDHRWASRIDRRVHSSIKILEMEGDPTTSSGNLSGPAYSRSTEFIPSRSSSED